MKERIVDEQIRLIPYYQNDAFGHVIGSEECEEGKIFIEPQGMCVMAGIGVDTGQAVTALQSVKDKLDTRSTALCCCSPPTRSTILNWAKFPAILRDTRRTQASSVTTTHGSAVPRL